jgi:hypothetical protein
MALSVLLLVACGPQALPTHPQPVATAAGKIDAVAAKQREAILESPKSARELLKYNDLFFVQNETWTAGSATPLGTVFVIRPGKEKNCDPAVQRTLDETEHFVAASLDQPNKPEKLRSIVVDHNVATQLDFLSFVSVEVKAEDVLSLTMTSEPRSVVRDTKWSLELNKLKQDNPQLWKDNCWVGIVTNMTKRSLTYRKYSKLEAGASGGAYGLKVGGNSYASDLDEEVSYVFGLNIVSLDPPKSAAELPKPDEPQPASVTTTPILKSVKKIQLRDRKLP